MCTLIVTSVISQSLEHTYAKILIGALERQVCHDETLKMKLLIINVT